MDTTVLPGTFWATVLTIYAHPVVMAVLGLLAGNIVTGIAASLYNKSFYLGELGNWLLTRAVPYLLGAGAVQMVLLTVPPEWSGVTNTVATTVWIFVCASLVGKILANLRDMGMPVPDVLTDKPKAAVKAEP